MSCDRQSKPVHNINKVCVVEHNKGCKTERTDECHIVGSQGGDMTIYAKGGLLSYINLSSKGVITLAVAPPNAPGSPLSFLELSSSGIRGFGSEINVKSSSPALFHIPQMDPPSINPGGPGERPPGLPQSAIECILKALKKSTYKDDKFIFNEESAQAAPAGAYRYGAVPYMEFDANSVPNIFNLPIVTAVVAKSIEKINQPDIVEQIERDSRFLCFLTVEQVAAFLSAYSLNPLNLIQLLGTIQSQLGVPSIFHELLEFLVNKINCFLSMAYFLSEYQFTDEERDVLERCIQVTYLLLTAEEKAKVDSIEQKFLSDWGTFLSTAETCFGSFPELPSLITGSCIDNLDEVISLFGGVITDSSFFETLKEEFRPFTTDDALINATLDQISEFWQTNEVVQAAKDLMIAAFNTAKGSIFLTIDQFSQGLMLSIEPIRRFVEFLQTGIDNSSDFIETVAEMVCAANEFAELFNELAETLFGEVQIPSLPVLPSSIELPVPTSFPRIPTNIAAYDIFGLNKPIADMIMDNLEVSTQTAATEAKEIENEILSEMATKAHKENEKQLFEEQKAFVEERKANADEFLSDTADFEEVVIQEQVRKRDPFRPPNVGDALDVLWIKGDQQSLQEKLKDVIGPVKALYFSKIFPEGMVELAKIAYKAPTMQDLYDRMKSVLQEDYWEDAVLGIQTTIETIDTAKIRLQTESALADDLLANYDENLAAINQDLADVNARISQLNQELSKKRIQQAKNNREFLDIELMLGECLAGHFFDFLQPLIDAILLLQPPIPSVNQTAQLAPIIAQIGAAAANPNPVAAAAQVAAATAQLTALTVSSNASAAAVNAYLQASPISKMLQPLTDIINEIERSKKKPTLDEDC